MKVLSINLTAKLSLVSPKIPGMLKNNKHVSHYYASNFKCPSLSCMLILQVNCTLQMAPQAENGRGKNRQS